MTNNTVTMSLEELATRLQASRMDALEIVERILTGIDKTETESPDGWWETSTGADFGNKKLNQIKALLSAIRVKDFGAKGDGITDDSEAFQTAVIYAVESKGKAPSPEWLDLLLKELRAEIHTARDELLAERTVQILPEPMEDPGMIAGLTSRYAQGFNACLQLWEESLK